MTDNIQTIILDKKIFYVKKTLKFNYLINRVLNV